MRRTVLWVLVARLLDGADLLHLGAQCIQSRVLLLDLLLQGEDLLLQREPLPLGMLSAWPQRLPGCAESP